MALELSYCDDIKMKSFRIWCMSPSGNVDLAYAAKEKLKKKHKKRYKHADRDVVRKFMIRIICASIAYSFCGGVSYGNKNKKDLVRLRWHVCNTHTHTHISIINFHVYNAEQFTQILLEKRRERESSSNIIAEDMNFVVEQNGWCVCVCMCISCSQPK